MSLSKNSRKSTDVDNDDTWKYPTSYVTLLIFYAVGWRLHNPYTPLSSFLYSLNWPAVGKSYRFTLCWQILLRPRISPYRSLSFQRYQIWMWNCTLIMLMHLFQPRKGFGKRPHQHLNDWDMNKSGFTTEQIYIYAKKKKTNKQYK